MLKKSITYTNLFTDEEVTEDHYFHISKADLVEMEMGEHKDVYVNKAGEKITGMAAKLQRIVDSDDGKAIMFELRDLIRRSYGKKVGERFVKSDEIWQEFSSSEAYSQLIFELCTDAEKAAEFQVGIIPKELEEAALVAAAKAKAEIFAAAEAKAEIEVPAVSNGVVETDDVITLRQRELQEATPEHPVQLTREEFTAMNDADLKAGLESGRFTLSL
ncbi:MAG TPA: hypothetical protein VN843_31940 [Anaerolineales bacterium]|nr:hypothetical protein [Anaerolineales bacterium]